jgi:small subunit ribosomal protein S12e
MQTDQGEKPHKVMACSCVGVKDYGEKSQAKEVVEEYFRWKK